MPEQKEEQQNKQEAKNPVILSIQLRKTLPPLITNNDTVFVWEKNHYIELKDAKIHKLIFKFFEDNKILPYWRKSKANEMIEALKVNSQIPEVEEMDPYDNLINLNNTVFNLETFKTEKQTEDLYFSYALDVDYDPKLTEADHPVFTQFLDDILRVGKKNDRETMELIFYVMAYLIYPKIKMEKIFLFIGGGSNGKSILIEIIKSFFPKKYVTSLSLNIMSNDESFNRNPLFYSKLNISTEAKVGKKVDSEEIKKISSGEGISLRNLNKEAISNFESKTKIVLAGNDFIYMNDSTDGMDRRFCMFKFPNQFLHKEKYEKYKNPGSHNVYLAVNKDKLIEQIKAERPAIFNTLVKYLHKLLNEKNWVLPETTNTKELMQEYKESSDTLGSWLLDNYIEVEDGKLTDSPHYPSSIDILNDFREYYEENIPGKRFNYSSGAVGKKLKQLFKVESDRRYRDIRISKTGITKSQRVTVYPVKRIDEEQTELILTNIQDTPQECLPPTPEEPPQDKFDDFQPTDDYLNS